MDLLASVISSLFLTGLGILTLAGKMNPHASVILGYGIYPAYLYGHVFRIFKIPAEERKLSSTPRLALVFLVLAIVSFILPLLAYVILLLGGT